MSKKIAVFSGILVILCVAFAYAVVFEIENESEKVLITMINQEPDPVAPGETVDVRFRFENMKSEALKNVEVKLESEYPFSVYYSGENIQQIGTLAPKQKDETGVRVKFKLRVDKNAAEGDNELFLWYRADNGGWIKAGDFTVEVRERDAILAINEIETDSDKMLPGTQNKVSFNLQNLASSVLKDIKLNLDLRERLATTTSITYNELPFTPIGSSNEKTLSIINPGKTEKIGFDLFIDADAESKVYKVPYTLTYSDETGKNFSRTGYVGGIVDAEPDLSINIDTTDIYSAGAKGNVNIKFVNKGFSNIKFLDVYLKQSQDFDLLSNAEVYIGNIDSDDYETAEYQLIVGKDAQGEVALPLKVEYRDANGKLYSKDVNLKLELFSGQQLKERQIGEGNSAVGIIIVAVIVVAGILFWRWRKKRKKAVKK